MAGNAIPGPRSAIGGLLAFSLCFPCSTSAAPATFLFFAACGSTLPITGGGGFIPIHTLGPPISTCMFAADATGARATSYTGTVSFSSSDATAGLPPRHTFTPAENGEIPVTITFRTLGAPSHIGLPGVTEQSVTMLDSANRLSGYELFYLLPGPAGGAQLTPTPIPTLSTIAMAILALFVAAVGTVAKRSPNHAFNRTPRRRGFARAARRRLT